MYSVTISNAIAHIKKGEARALKAGGAWIYDNEVADIDGIYSNGDILKVEDFDGYPLGYGMINTNSTIRIRMLTRSKECFVTLGESAVRTLLTERVKEAWNYRMAVVPPCDRSAFRVIFGEADWLPGLVVDKYEKVLVIECLSMGMDRLKEYVLTELMNCMGADGFTIDSIYERSDAPVRKKEGMPTFKGLIYHNELWMDASQISAQSSPEGRMKIAEEVGFTPFVSIIENNIKYTVDVENGQKTGFFLDQKFNRQAMQNICYNLLSTRLNCTGNQGLDELVEMKVLDCFTHMGTFALNCGLALKNAVVDSAVKELSSANLSVTGLDISEFAVSQATTNSANNGLSEIVKFRAANVLDELPRLYEAGEKYDIVILDPPAFTKSREATKNAIKGYREINMKGMKLVKDGGYLATCSCSHFMNQELFTTTIAQASKAVHKRLRQIEFRTQGPDHPILWSADESYYLKFLIFQVVDEK